ncbi:MAG TPA: ATP-binding protein [Stellaceae bacterium]|jgi:two-component system osmolarity sensor histidine kinase EnvZ|nr:ATP-binding protein [Stellaceae bacterium]
MSSSPIERAALPAEVAPRRPAPADSHRRWWKRVLPRSLFGRSLIIIILPLVLAQLLATWIFYDRHWATVERRLATDVASDIAVAIDARDATHNRAALERLLARTGDVTELHFTFVPGERLPPAPPDADASWLGGDTWLDEALSGALAERVGRPFRLDTESDPRYILIAIALSDGVMHVEAPRTRLFTPTTYIFVLWMAGSSLVLLAVASLFMRNQVRSLRRLAAAAESFGKGRDVPNFKLEGATEVRQAAAAFLKMRDRIRRQITQRTEMLAGVSHDLRTPLTRMRLALEFLGKGGPEVEELKEDVIIMERMVQGYLDFARGEGPEQPRQTDLGLLLEEVAAAARRDGGDISLALPEEIVLPLRPDAMRRCLANLLSNARRYGSHTWITALPVAEGVDILVDDDGPGIPAAERENVFRPFFRLDSSRNPATGGVGLGLTIARDVARGHGGDLTLEESPQHGLRVRLHLPR